MNNFLTNGFRMLGAVLFVAPFAAAQSNAIGGQPVYGRCEVKAEAERDNFGECRLTGTLDGIVPADRRLVIEHIAVGCTGPVDRQILMLALGTNLTPDGETLTQILIPLIRREVLTTQKVSRYETSLLTRLYAGPGTRIEPYLAMEFGYVPSPKAVCGIMFHGSTTKVEQ